MLSLRRLILLVATLLSFVKAQDESAARHVELPSSNVPVEGFSRESFSREEERDALPSGRDLGYYYYYYNTGPTHDPYYYFKHSDWKSGKMNGGYV